MSSDSSHNVRICACEPNIKSDAPARSRHTPLHSIKVVIVGQDPYHNHNQAHGLAFSVRPPTPAPPSLKNMYIALKNDYPDFTPPPNRGGLLTPWADQGVLLINTCLTVRAGDAKSHGNRGWERLTQRVIDIVAARRSRGVVFMAWGTPAAMVVKKVDTAKHLVLKAVHPSPLSASRGFFTCGHFRKANEWLAKKYGPGSEIDWNLGPKQPSIDAAVGAKKDEPVKNDENGEDEEDWEDAEAERVIAEAEAAASAKAAATGEGGVRNGEQEVKKGEDEDGKEDENGEAKVVDSESNKDAETNGVGGEVKKNGEGESKDSDTEDEQVENRE